MKTGRALAPSILAALFALVAVATLAWGQAPRKPDARPTARAGAAAEKPAPPAAPPTAPDTAGAGDASGPDIDQILEGEEEVLSGNGYSYDPGNRRDPFKSLLVAPDRPEFHGPRPEGIPGLLIDEVDLTGIFRKGGIYIAQVKAANNPQSYLLRVGDQLFDGDVVSINQNEVVFKQAVQDPTALKPFREVVKALKP
jgi:hypothetical protein